MIAIDNHTSATISLVGMLFDAVGGLYLAYDLLGGEKGPLSTFTRAVTYSLIMSFSYGLTMGMRFGILAGVGLGTALGLHLERIGRGKKDTPLFMLMIALIRAVGLGAAVWTTGHPVAALVVSAVAFFGSILLPIFNISPALLVETGKRPSFNKKKLGLSLFFGCMVLLVDFLLVQLGLAGAQNYSVAFRISFTVVMVTLFVGTISPVIEWYADHVEPRFLGYVGAIMFIIGFFIQSLPSLLVVIE